MCGGVGRRAISIAAGAGRVRVALQLLKRLVPCEWHRSTATRPVGLHFCLSSFALVLLMQILNAVVNVFVAFGGFRRTLARARRGFGCRR